MTKQMILELDEEDWDTIQSYIANFQSASRGISPNNPTIVADGESNLAGAILSECVRDLLEYRDLFNSDNPHD